MQVRASRDIAGGEELCISYGTLTNASLLHTYGFIDRDNNENFAVMIPSSLVVSTVETMVRKTVVWLTRLQRRGESCAVCDASGGGGSR